MAIQKMGNVDYAARRIRHGKTAKDHRSGAYARRLANMADKNAWHNDNKATAGKFPEQCLKGNGNSSNRRPERRPGKATKS